VPLPCLIQEVYYSEGSARRREKEGLGSKTRVLTAQGESDDWSHEDVRRWFGWVRVLSLKGDLSVVLKEGEESATGQNLQRMSQRHQGKRGKRVRAAKKRDIEVAGKRYHKTRGNKKRNSRRDGLAGGRPFTWGVRKGKLSAKQAAHALRRTP